MQIYLEKGKHNPLANELFPPGKFDAFHNEEILTAFYGSDWYSVLITHDGNAFLHVFRKNIIEGTGFYDIEPFLGYSGPVLKFDSPGFAGIALKKYSELCREEKIVAELMRFHPLMDNHLYFSGSEKLKVLHAKDIVISECFEDETRQLNSFSKIGRYETRKAIGECRMEIKERDTAFLEFKDMYFQSLKRTKAGKQWFFDDGFFDRVQNDKNFEVRTVYYNDKISSSTLAIFFPSGSYYLLAANAEEKPLGANNFLLFRLAIESAKRGIKNLILGGGVAADSNDSLFRFKKKFSKRTYPFYIGKIIHIYEEYDKLCKEAEENKPELANSNILLKYRLIQ